MTDRGPTDGVVARDDGRLDGMDPIELEDVPPGALDVIACLVGQHDGKVFIPRRIAYLLHGKTVVRLWEDPERDGWTVEVKFVPHDGTSRTKADLPAPWDDGLDPLKEN